MIDRTVKEEKRLSDAMQLIPYIKVKAKLGHGNRGEAYLLENGNVLKITFDSEEYSTAMVLKNKDLNHIVHIYDCWEFKHFDDEGCSNTIFAVVQEYVDTVSQKEEIVSFIKIFKHAWFSVYFSNTNATFDDLDEYLRNPTTYSDAIDFTRKNVLEEGERLNKKKIFALMYDQLVFAYTELYLNSPKSHLDLNDGNLGFTSDGILKVFDMQ